MPKVRVKDVRNANLSPKSRWGVVAFDKDGIASIEVPDADLPMLTQFGWEILDGVASPPPAPAPKAPAAEEVGFLAKKGVDDTQQVRTERPEPESPILSRKKPRK